jgi:hypothetical protein
MQKFDFLKNGSVLWKITSSTCFPHKKLPLIRSFLRKFGKIKFFDFRPHPMGYNWFTFTRIKTIRVWICLNVDTKTLNLVSFHYVVSFVLFYLIVSFVSYNTNGTICLKLIYKNQQFGFEIAWILTRKPWIWLRSIILFHSYRFKPFISFNSVLGTLFRKPTTGGF